MARTWTDSQTAAMTLRGKSLLVSAAAGSGKTSVLTERIIRSLTDRDHPADISRLLIVTFTRAAAAELKSRIATALTNALAEAPGDTRLSKQLMLLGGAQISTIDSFFQKIVRTHFEELGIPASFRIADDAEILPISSEIMDTLVEEFYRRYDASPEGASPLQRLSSNAFASVLDHLLSNRSDGALNDVLLDFFQMFSSYPEGIRTLKHCADELLESASMDFMETRYGKALSEQLQELFESYRSELEEIGKQLQADPDHYAKCSGLFSTDLDYCNGVLDALQEHSYPRLQAVTSSFIAGRFPTIKNKSKAVERYQNFRKAFRKQLEATVFQKLTWPEDLVRNQLAATASICTMLYEFYAEYENRLMAEKHLRGILEYNDIRSMLYRMLSSEDGTASAFAKSLAAQYDAVYIDEYQDVDLLQDRIFALIGENRRFMVGDIKQSIYGFRGSDPSIFADYRRKMPLYTEKETGSANGICVFMSENFRCDRPVIDFANQICGFLFSACEKSVGYTKQDDLVCSKYALEKTEPQTPPVQVAVFDPPPRRKKGDTESDGEDPDFNAEARWTALEISRLLREEHLDNGAPISPSDIAILVRNKASGATFMKELETLKIPVNADSSNDFLREPLVTDVLNLLRSLDNPYRDLPLSEFLLSPLGDFSLEEISEIREGLPNQHSFYDAMLEKAEETDALGEKVKQVLNWMTLMREQATVLPADRFLRLLYLEDRLMPFSRDPILLFLYEQARLYQRNSWAGLYGFLKHIDKLLDGQKISANGLVKAESAVTIMTIHHSKGLEFPVVFVAACGSEFNRSDLRDTLMFHRSIGCASKLYNPLTGDRENTLLCELVKQELDAEQTEEGIRTLYVALTRARERLYVTGTLRGKWETSVANASVIHRGNRAAILSAGNYLTWILAAQQDSLSQGREFPCIFHHISPDEVIPSTACEPTSNGSNEIVSPVTAPVSEVALQYAKIYRMHVAASQVPDILHRLPTKIAASKLEPKLLDLILDPEDNDRHLEMQIEWMRSEAGFESLLSSREKASAADIGTATHAFLEFCDFNTLRETEIEKECARLVTYGFLSERTASIVDKQLVTQFSNSRLMDWITKAKRIYREQKFGLLIPYSEFTGQPELAKHLDGQRLFVQGSIDLLLEMEDGSLYLIDYKTDRMHADEKENPSLFVSRMKRAHGTQLTCYARAVEELFGKKPEKIFLYSFALGKEIDFFTT